MTARYALAADLIRALEEVEVFAQSVDLSPSPNAGVNVWADSATRYPDDTVVIDGEEFAWGDRFQHTLPLETPVGQVAEAVLATLR